MLVVHPSSKRLDRPCQRLPTATQVEGPTNQPHFGTVSYWSSSQSLTTTTQPQNAVATRLRAVVFELNSWCYVIEKNDDGKMIYQRLELWSKNASTWKIDEIVVHSSKSWTDLLRLKHTSVYISSRSFTGKNTAPPGATNFTNNAFHFLRCFCSALYVIEPAKIRVLCFLSFVLWHEETKLMLGPVAPADIIKLHSFISSEGKRKKKVQVPLDQQKGFLWFASIIIVLSSDSLVVLFYSIGY